MHCKPIHTPNKGTMGPNSNTVCNDIPESLGSPTKGRYCVLKTRMTTGFSFASVFKHLLKGNISITNLALGRSRLLWDFSCKKARHYGVTIN
jgi:hypothetical protein